MIIPSVNDLDETLSVVWAGKTTIPTNYDVLESTDVTKTKKQNNNKNLLTYQSCFSKSYSLLAWSDNCKNTTPQVCTNPSN